MPDLDFFALVLIGGAVVLLAILDKLTWTVADLAHRRLDAVRAELEARIDAIEAGRGADAGGEDAESEGGPGS
jgi:hypothetical protein